MTRHVPTRREQTNKHPERAQAASLRGRAKRLVVFDMDSTLIQQAQPPPSLRKRSAAHPAEGLERARRV
jgi:hypothetical protein